MGGIYWKEIRGKPGKVTLKGSPGSRSYYFKGKWIYWEGNEALAAQLYLDSRVRGGA